MTSTFDPDDLEGRADGVRALARSLLADEHCVDDVIQEALLAVDAQSSAHVRSPRRWLRGVVRNLALRTRRDAETRRRHEGAAPARTSPGDPAEIVARAELHRLVVQALLDLEEPYRCTLLRRFLDGLSAAAIAREQGVPAATVRTRVRRGLARLRERLDGEHGERRSWSLLLAPLLADPRVLDPAPAPPASVLPFAVGVTAMIAKKLALSVAVALLLLAIVVGADQLTSGTTRSAHSGEDAGFVDAPHRRPRDAADDAAAPQLPTPVDLAAVDRDLDLHGRVVDSAGEPVRDAAVTALHRPWRRTSVLVVDQADLERTGPSTRTASDGTFSLRLRRGERVDLRAEAEGFGALVRPSCFAGQRVELVLVAGVDLVLSVVDEEGEPVADARVRLYRREDLFVGLPRIECDGRSGSDGACRLENLPADAVGTTLIVEHPLAGIYTDSSFRLPASGVRTLTTTLRAGRVVRGRITDAVTGEPIEAARVGASWTQSNSVLSDSEGHYALAVDDGFAITARADGYGASVGRIGTATEVNVALVREARLTGRVVDVEGAAVPGAHLSAIGEQTAHGARSRGNAVTGPDGRFDVGGLRGSEAHALIVLAAGHARSMFDVDAPGEPGATVDVGDLHLPASAIVSGRVLLPDGSPATRANVTLSGRASGVGRTNLRAEGGAVAEHYGTEEDAWVDDLGRFHFTDVAAGSYAVRAVIPGRKNASASAVAVVDAGAVEPLTLRFVGGERLTARVRDDAGAPVDHVSVTAATADNWSLHHPTDGDGLAIFESDSRVVRLSVYGFPSPSHSFIFPPTVRVPEGAEEIDLTLRRADASRGVVLAPDGTPLPSVRLAVLQEGRELRQDNPFRVGTWARESGEFEILVPRGEGVDVELREAVVPASGGAPPRAVVGRLTAVKGARNDLVLQTEYASTDHTLSLLVLDPDGRAEPGATVRCNLAGGGELPPQVTSRAGRVWVPDLPALPLVVSVELADGHPGRARWVAPRQRLTPGADEEHVLQFTVGDRVEGTVVDADGAPVPEATAWLYDARRSRIVNVFTDSAGRFAFALDVDAPRPLQLFVFRRTSAGTVREYRDPDFRPATGLRLTITSAAR